MLGKILFYIILLVFLVDGLAAQTIYKFQDPNIACNVYLKELNNDSNCLIIQLQIKSDLLLAQDTLQLYYDLNYDEGLVYFSNMCTEIDCKNDTQYVKAKDGELYTYKLNFPPKKQKVKYMFRLKYITLSDYEDMLNQLKPEVRNREREKLSNTVLSLPSFIEYAITNKIRSELYDSKYYPNIPAD